MSERKDKILKAVENNNIDGIFITGIPNIRYITNFSGEDGFLLATKRYLILIVDPRFTLQAEKESFKETKVIEYKGKIASFLRDILLTNKIHWLGVEKERISYGMFKELEDIPFIKLVPTMDFVEKARMIKSEEEIKKIRKAFEISSKSFLETLKLIKEGVTEQEIASELEYRFRKNGGDKPSFDTIVASGKRGALPHGVASNKKIKAHEPIVFDFGTFYQGYASDTTRVVCIGEPNNEVKEMYKVVRDAQKLGVESAREGIKALELDKIVRDYIKEKKLGDHFTHGLGHGVGLEIHELPFINGNSDLILQENMVITIEPGIYIKDKFGLRLEDTIIVRKNKPVNLVELPHEIMVI